MRFTGNEAVSDLVASDAAAYIRDWFDRTAAANPVAWSVAKEWAAKAEDDGTIVAQCELMPADAVTSLADDVGEQFPEYTELRLGMQIDGPTSCDELDWVAVPAGDVIVRNSARTVAAFEITFTPITLGQFREFLDATLYTPVPDQIEDNPGYLIDHFTLNFGPSPRQVLFGVTNDDAVAYCEWAGLRLPTEVELARFFEWAVRDRRKFDWGGECWTSTTTEKDKFVSRNGPYHPEALEWPEARHRTLLHRHQYQFLEAPCFRVVKTA